MSKPNVLNPAILADLHEQFNHDRPTPEPLGKLLNRVICADSAQVLRLIPDESVDLILTDEPYGLEKGTLIAMYGRQPLSMSFDWDEELPAHLLFPWIYEAARILKPGGALINGGLASWNTTIEAICTDAGLNFRMHNVWLKTNPPTRFRHGGFLSAYEMIWVASKGSLRQRMRKTSQTDLINWTIEVKCPACELEFPASLANRQAKLEESEWLDWVIQPHLAPTKAGRRRRGHQTEKPDWWAARYIWLLSSPGDLVLDPFMGSGTVILQAARTGRNYIGIDLNQEWVEVVEKNLQINQAQVME